MKIDIMNEICFNEVSFYYDFQSFSESHLLTEKK